MIQGRADINQSELIKKQQEEVGRIRSHNQITSVKDMLVHKERIYVVHGTGLVAYCYNPDGSPSETYEHRVEQKLMLRECV